MSTCTEKCWTAVPCPAHGDSLPPRGRSAGEDFYRCCESYSDSDVNPRHLWNEHDSTRYYTDPEGWAEHERDCAECNPDHDDD